MSFRGRTSDSAFMSDPDYKFNQVQIKEYSDSDGNIKYKLVFLSALRTKGIEHDENVEEDKKVEYNNSEKFEESLIRAKSTIYDLAFCNSWQYFFTGTLNPKKYKPEDLNIFHKDFTQWIRNFNRLHSCNIKFLIVPELHSNNKSWHFHGFLFGLPAEFLDKFEREQFYPFTDVRLPYKLLWELDSGFAVYSWVAYQKKFGWNTLEPIKDHFAISGYVTKYITKDVLKSVSDVGAHTYYRSRGLRTPKTVFSGNMDLTLFNSLNYSCENKYVKVAWLDPDQYEIIKGVLDNVEQ